MRVSRSCCSISKAMEELENKKSRIHIFAICETYSICGLPTFGYLGKICHWFNDPSGQNDTVAKFADGINKTDIDFRISLQIFKKIRNGTFEIFSGMGEDDAGKKSGVKNLAALFL